LFDENEEGVNLYKISIFWRYDQAP